MEKLDTILSDVLNAGIAIFRKGEDTVSKTLADLQKSFDALKKAGEKDKSEAAEKLRSQLDDLLKNTNDLTSKAEGAYKETLSKIEANYKEILIQADKILPKEQIAQVQKNIDELFKTIQEKMDTLSKAAKSGSDEEAKSKEASPSQSSGKSNTES